jgi:hypothetical protein
MAQTLDDLREWVRGLGHAVLRNWIVVVRDNKIIVYNPNFPTEHASFDTESDETKRGGSPMKCSICDKEIPVKEGGWDSGNNAQPVNDGRCCDKCNMDVVIPERLQQAIWVRRKQEEKDQGNG